MVRCLLTIEEKRTKLKKNMKNIITIAASILILNACGDKDKEEIVAIDTSSVQTLDKINVTTNTYCLLGEELVKGGGSVTDPELLEASKWKMTLDSGKSSDLILNDCIINDGTVRECIQVDPQAAGTGMYQEIVLVTGKRYRVSAELIGADNVNDKNNFELGSSYVSIEDHKPVEKSIPIAHSEKVIGNTPKKVIFDFNTTKETNYISLRGDRAYKYPTAFFISVKELIVKTKENNSTVDSNTTENNVSCNL
jgi:hypothetical protein